MAEREDIRDRVRRINPQALMVTDTLTKVLKEMGQRAVIVNVTDDMTPEEEEMAIFAVFVKQGCSVEEASRKAKERLRLIHSSF